MVVLLLHVFDYILCRDHVYHRISGKSVITSSNSANQVAEANSFRRFGERRERITPDSLPHLRTSRTPFFGWSNWFPSNITSNAMWELVNVAPFAMAVDILPIGKA